MSKSQIIEKKYELNKENRIGYGKFGGVYKVKNIKNGYYYAIKEIDRQKFTHDINKLKKDINNINQMGGDNNINIIETLETNDYLYIVMELCECNLDDYLKKRENKISINELREILIQLNNTFKIRREKKIIYKDFKPQNILISLNKLDKCLIKFSDFGISKFIEKNDSNDETSHGAMYTMSPEVIENGDDSLNEKSEIWSLGVTIYYLLFKEYPYLGNNEYQLLNDIKSNKTLKKTDDEELNNLLNRMLQKEVSDRISWDDYFNHPFFKTNNSLVSFPQFNFECQKHNSQICYYCKTCKRNICNECLNKEPNSHEIISISKIGLTDDEINKYDNFKKEIKNNIDKFKNMIDKTDALLEQMKKIKENKFIYQNDNLNNHKKYYLDCYDVLNQQLKNKINQLNINVQDNSQNRNNTNSNTYNNSNNFIICEHIINDSKLSHSIQILNSYEGALNNDSNLEGSNNKNDIEKNCELYLNDKKISFSFKIKFTQTGKNVLKFVFKKPLSNLNFMFYNCKTVKSIDLSNFNTYNVNNMSYMFCYCQSLTSINFSNINTENVTNMSRMFNYCQAIQKLDLSHFNTAKVVNMKFMFCHCDSLNEINVSNFNTKNVLDMNSMFNTCKKLKRLDLSKFETNNVTNMFNMFCDCSSLEYLNINSFTTEKVSNMGGMLYHIPGSCNVIANDKKILDLFKEKK